MDPDILRALKSEWEAGVLTIHQLAVKYEITDAKVRSLAIKYGWSRLLPPDEEKVMKAVQLFSFDAEKQQVLSAGQIVAVHRQDVARLRSLSATLVDRLGLVLAGKPCELPCMGSRESPADLLEKLSRVMVRTTEIERQAYGLKTFAPEQAASDAQLQAELDKLTAEVEEIAARKSLGVE